MSILGHTITKRNLTKGILLFTTLAIFTSYVIVLIGYVAPSIDYPERVSGTLARSGLVTDSFEAGDRMTIRTTVNKPEQYYVRLHYPYASYEFYEPYSSGWTGDPIYYLAPGFQKSYVIAIIYDPDNVIVYSEVNNPIWVSAGRPKQVINFWEIPEDSTEGEYTVKLFIWDHEELPAANPVTYNAYTRTFTVGGS